MKLVSIVIPTRNRAEIAGDCIDSVLNSTYKKIEIIVVDDASTDGTAGFLEKKYGELIKLVRLENHAMMVRARNVGARCAGGEYVLFVDDDNVIDPGMIENLINCIEKNEDYGIVGPKMHLWDDRLLAYLTGQRISLWTGKTTGIAESQDDSAAVKDSDGIPNVFMIRKQLFKDVGYFDENLVQTWIEPDFSFAAKKRGYQTVICQDASTYHRILKSETTLANIIGGKGFKHKAYFLTRNRFVFIKRYASPLQLFFFALTFSWIFPMVYSLVALRHEEFDIAILYWKGFKDGMHYLATNKFKESLGGIK